MRIAWCLAITLQIHRTSPQNLVRAIDLFARSRTFDHMSENFCFCVNIAIWLNFTALRIATVAIVHEQDERSLNMAPTSQTPWVSPERIKNLLRAHRNVAVTRVLV